MNRSGNFPLDAIGVFEDERQPLIVEAQKDVVKYPRSIFFIISNEFFERFNYYGMRSESNFF